MIESHRQTAAWKPSLLLAITLLFCVPIALHVPHINGNPYWTWPYRRLRLWPLLPLMTSAIIPMVIAQFLVARRRISPASAVWLIGFSTILLRYAAVTCIEEPPSLSIPTQIVKHRTTFSYYFDAGRISRDVGAGRMTWADIIKRYPGLMSNLNLHTRIRPPGGILLSGALIRIFGDPAAASALALLIAIVAALSPPAVYWMMRRLARSPEEALAAASLLALCPGFLLFFPMFDPMYVTTTAVLVIVWTKALESPLRAAVLWAALLGLLLSAALFVTYNFLVLGIFLGGLTLPRIRKHKSGDYTFVACISLILTVVIVYLAAWHLIGFDPLSTMGTALANEHRNKVAFGRFMVHSQWWDLWDFSLAAAHLGIPLSLIYIFSRLPRGQKLIPILGLLQILTVDLAGALPFETSRVWLVLLPMLMISAGAEIGRWPIRHRVVAYGCMAITTFIVCQNLWLVTYNDDLLPAWSRPQKLTGPHAKVILPPPGLQ